MGGARGQGRGRAGLGLQRARLVSLPYQLYIKAGALLKIWVI